MTARLQAAVSGNRCSAKKRAVAIRRAPSRARIVERGERALGEIGAARGEAEEAEIRRRAGERLRGPAALEQREEMRGRRLEIVERRVEPRAHAAEVGPVLRPRAARRSRASSAI